MTRSYSETLSYLKGNFNIKHFLLKIHFRQWHLRWENHRSRILPLQRSGHFFLWDATVLFIEVLPDRSSHLSQARPDGNARLHLWALPSDRIHNIWLRRDCHTDSALWFPAECPRSHLLPPPGQWFLWRPLSESDCQCLWTPRRKSPFRFSPVW